MKKQNLTLRPNVALNPQEAKVVSLFRKHGSLHSYLAYKHEKIIRLGARVCDLKNKGAEITTNYLDIYFENEFHPRVAHYQLNGFKNLEEAI